MNPNSISSKLQDLFDLFKAGALTQEEYDLIKSQLLQSKSTSISDTTNGIKSDAEKHPNELSEDKDQIQEITIKGAENSIRNGNRAVNLTEILDASELIKNERQKSKSKFIVIGIILFLIIACGTWIYLKSLGVPEADKNSDLAKMNLHGKIKSITGKSEFKEDGSGESDGESMDESYQKIIYNFNRNGNIDSKIYYSESGKDIYVINIKEVYTYNDKYQPVEKIFLNNNDKFIQSTKFTHNEQGKLIQTKNTECDECADTLFGYDMEGNLITKTVGDEYAINIKYDALRRKIGEKNDADYYYDYSYTYDDKDRLIEKLSYGAVAGFPKGKKIILRKDLYTYDSNNNISIEKYGDMLITEVIKGRLVFKFVPQPTSWITITYNYIYDEKGNWIKKTSLFNGENYRVETRDIEYFSNLFVNAY